MASPLYNRLVVRFKGGSLKVFFTKLVVTQDLFISFLQVCAVTFIFYELGHSFLGWKNRMTDENILSLYLNSAKFGMWFLFGYGAIQLFGVKIEKEKLYQLENQYYRTHAQKELYIWTDLDRSTNDDNTLKKVDVVDKQLAKVKGDHETAKWLWVIGFVLFLSISLFEIIYPAFK